jgi:hypothetical protein
MPLVQTRGAASAQGFGEFAQSAAPNYIEDVFSTYLTLLNSGTTQIAHGLDFSTYGGLTWVKNRTAAYGHTLGTTNIGTSKMLFTNTTDAVTSAASFASFDVNGTTITRAGGYFGNTNEAIASWNFRKQPKFFDVVTYSGTGSAQNISHSLGSVPGCIIVKRTNTAGFDWPVYHRSTGNTNRLLLNDTVPAAADSGFWNNTTPTSSVFTVGGNVNTNGSGGTYVAYLFAHDAGGFGLTGTDNVISCGSYTGTSAVGNAQTLGYEPQWILIKRNTASYDWTLIDTMRGWATNGADAELYPNSSNAEYFADNLIDVTATGFNFSVSGATALNTSGATYIYIAIRRGPMKVPTTGTSVYQADYRNATAPGYTSGFPVDTVIDTAKSGDNRRASSRLQGAVLMQVNSSIAETSDSSRKYDYMDGWSTDTGASTDYLSWMFRRAPGFHDVVCYTGTGSARTVSHNLQAVPELMIIKQRSSTNSGVVYTASGGTGVYLRLFDASSSDSGNTPTTGDEVWNSTTPTSSVFSVNASARVNGNASTYVAYLFATCAGVSKVGSYTGTGATQTINCGFTGGARFVLIKKSTQTAPDRDWYVWDTVRGMVSGTDPSLKLNTTAAEVNADNIYTVSTGFQIVSSADYVNASGVTYIFLAIA